MKNNTYTPLESVKISKKSRVLLRLDLNMSFDASGLLQDNTRLKACMPTLKYLIAKKAFITIISHKGRPIAGVKDEKESLQPLLAMLAAHLQQKVFWQPNWPHKTIEHDCQIELAENVRFLAGEVDNHDVLAKTMAKGYDLFVMDAFGCAHRQHASTYGVASYTVAAIGFLIKEELAAINGILTGKYQSIALVVGGAKISSKLPLLEALLPYVSSLFVGGGVANTLLYAKSIAIGSSLVDIDFLAKAKQIINKAEQKNINLYLPKDFICSDEALEVAQHKKIGEVQNKDLILDIGAKTWREYQRQLDGCDAIIWVGPLGLVEKTLFAKGTKSLCEYLAKTKAFTLLGGGDTVASMRKLHANGVSEIDIVSTGGGAFLAALTGKLAAFEHKPIKELL